VLGGGPEFVNRQCKGQNDLYWANGFHGFT